MIDEREEIGLQTARRRVQRIWMLVKESSNWARGEGYLFEEEIAGRLHD